MTDTGQVPGDGLPENAGMVEQPGVPAHGAYTYLSETPAEDEDQLLLPGAQSAWGNEVAPPAPEPVVETVHEPGPHETGGRDSGSVDLSAVRLPGPAAPPQSAPRRPLHLGPPIPDTSASPVRSLADRGPAGVPVRHPGPPASGPEYLDAPHLRELPPQGASPWGAPAPVPAAAPFATQVADQPTAPSVFPAPAQGPVVAETAAPVASAPEPEPVSAAQAVVARVATGASSAVDFGVVDPGQLLGAALIAEGEQDVADEVTAADGVESAPAPEPVVAPVVEQVQVAVGFEDVRAAETAVAPEVPETPGEPVAEAAPAAEMATPEVTHVPEAQEAAPMAQAPEPPVAVAPAPPEMPEPVAVVPEAPAAEPEPPVVVPEAPAAEPEPVAVAVAVAPETPAAESAPEPEAAPEPGPESEAAPESEAEVVAPAPEAPVAEPLVAVPEPAQLIDAPAAVVEPAQPEPAQQYPVEPTPEPQPQQEAEVEVLAVQQTDPASQNLDAVGAADLASAPVAPALEPLAPVTLAPLPEEPPAEAPAPEASAEAPAPEASALEAVAPVASAAEAIAPEAVAVEAVAPEAVAPEIAAPGFAAPQPVAPEAVAAEHVVPEAAVPEAAVPEVAVSEAVVPEAIAAEVVAPEAVVPQAVAPEAVASEAVAPEPAVIDVPTPEALAPEAPLPEPAAEEAAAEAGSVADAELAADAEPDATPTPHAPTDPTDHPAAAQPEQVVEPEQAVAPEQPVAEFVPVEGLAGPTTPHHHAPTPPHPLVLPTQDRQPTGAPAPQPVRPEQPEPLVPAAVAATVPAPRAGDPDPEVAQSPEDLETRAADQEEGTAPVEPAEPVEEARVSTGPAAPAYDDAEREAVLKVMRERRDIRNGFRSDPIPHEVLLRVLEAAHTAPSVGHSQPWDFVVIRSADTRSAMHELATRQRDAYAKSLPKGRAKQFKELKIEAILDTPVNIVVTADPTRGGRHTLGRHTQPQMAPYSSALAVENLWLAARAEGLGVGWVSFFDEREMVRALGLPEHLEVVAYLCVGYVDEFPDEPELMQAGWAKRRPLSWVVHEETYGRRALPGEDPHDLLAETVAGIRPLDAKALGEAWERQKRMTKPAGALGMLEIISAQLSGLSRQCPPPIPEPAAVAIFAGDHGVHAQGVTPWPQEVTAQMVANFLGGGAVCNAFASQVGAEVCVVDVGVAADLPATPGLLPRKVRAGTSDMTTGPAMTREEAQQAIEVGIETARDLVAAGNKALLTGEMGIANTTASAALISVFTGADPSEVTGRGTGINDETLARKTEVVRRALELHQPDPADPIGVLAAVGGFEHAAIVGLLLGGASLRTPVILDGVSAGAAALVARAIAPEVLAACIAGHRSAEPGHVAALNKLGLRPLVDLDLRLGEGTGALLALPLVQSTARAMHEVATFDSAGVTEK
ncbi:MULTISPECIES: nicotinate-nucleotide--dimethylbenzimidazole phosphoribosyltransferase [Streptomyces]|uniref:Nicotinate-nucleotide--dimethylbenzimidazole phosphoribosyltransferase n=2 Tax=Streptomyces TaxID=1883 RepID=A0ABV9IYI7_9ACTN